MRVRIAPSTPFKVIRSSLCATSSVARHKNSESDLVAVASSNFNRAIKFKSSYGAKRAYKSYNQLFEDEDVEVVYIASLNNHHKKMTFDALNSRKAVLCEKPLGLNLNEVRGVYDLL